MHIVWKQSPLAVPDIVERLERPLAYTTVMTTVRIMEDKGLVARCGKRGRAFLYRPTVSCDDVRDTMTQHLAKLLFSGSIKSMVLNLVENDSIDPQELAEVKQIILKLESRE